MTGSYLPDNSGRTGFRAWARTNKMPLDEVFNYFRRYDKRSFFVVGCMGNEPTEPDVAAFEAEAGFRVPDEFREFTLSPLGGLYMEVCEQRWHRRRNDESPPLRH